MGVSHCCPELLQCLQGIGILRTQITKLCFEGLPSDFFCFCVATFPDQYFCNTRLGRSNRVNNRTGFPVLLTTLGAENPLIFFHGILTALAGLKLFPHCPQLH